jgi:hypothetical protein
MERLFRRIRCSRCLCVARAASPHNYSSLERLNSSERGRSDRSTLPTVRRTASCFLAGRAVEIGNNLAKRRREPRNVLAGMLGKLDSVIACHEVGTRIFAATPDASASPVLPAASAASSSRRARASSGKRYNQVLSQARRLASVNAIARRSSLAEAATSPRQAAAAPAPAAAATAATAELWRSGSFAVREATKRNLARDYSLLGQRRRCEICKGLRAGLDAVHVAPRDKVPGFRRASGSDISVRKTWPGSEAPRAALCSQRALAAPTKERAPPPERRRDPRSTRTLSIRRASRSSTIDPWRGRTCPR